MEIQFNEARELSLVLAVKNGISRLSRFTVLHICSFCVNCVFFRPMEKQPWDSTKEEPRVLLPANLCLLPVTRTKLSRDFLNIAYLNDSFTHSTRIVMPIDHPMTLKTR